MAKLNLIIDMDTGEPVGYFIKGHIPFEQLEETVKRHIDDDAELDFVSCKQGYLRAIPTPRNDTNKRWRLHLQETERGRGAFAATIFRYDVFYGGTGIYNEVHRRCGLVEVYH